MSELSWRLNPQCVPIFTCCLPVPSLDGGSDGPHGGPRWHPACQPLQGEDLHVWRGVWLLSQSGQSRVKAQIKRNETNAAFVFLEYALKPFKFIFFFLCRRRCTELQPKGWLRVSSQATMPPCLPTDPQVCVCVCFGFFNHESCFTSHVFLWVETYCQRLYAPPNYPSVSLTSSPSCLSICLRESQLFVCSHGEVKTGVLVCVCLCVFICLFALCNVVFRPATDKLRWHILNLPKNTVNAKAFSVSI